MTIPDPLPSQLQLQRLEEVQLEQHIRHNVVHSTNDSDDEGHYPLNADESEDAESKCSEAADDEPEHKMDERDDERDEKEADDDEPELEMDESEEKEEVKSVSGRPMRRAALRATRQRRARLAKQASVKRRNRPRKGRAAKGGRWMFESIQSERVVDGKREFLVRWVGCGPEDDTWEPEANIPLAHRRISAQ